MKNTVAISSSQKRSGLQFVQRASVKGARRAFRNMVKRGVINTGSFAHMLGLTDIERKVESLVASMLLTELRGVVGYTKRLGSFSVKATDGSKLLSRYFPGFHPDPNFKKWGLDVPGTPTARVKGIAFDVVKKASVAEMLAKLAKDPSTLCFEQSQICELFWACPGFVHVDSAVGHDYETIVPLKFVSGKGRQGKCEKLYFAVYRHRGMVSKISLHRFSSLRRWGEKPKINCRILILDQ